MSSGIKYARHGILFAAELDDVVTFPDCVLYDLTHCMYSSGGINQYHVNQLIRVLVSGGACTIDTIDRFFAEVKQPKSWPGIKRGFVKGRMVDSPTAHMKGFASDTIAATYLLELFVDIFIQPQNIFLEEIQVLRKLSDLTRLCTKADDPEQALRVCQQHHEGFMGLYGYACGVPKLHYTFEAIKGWKRRGWNRTTFNAEATHTLPKRLMHFTYKKADYACMAHWLRHIMNKVSQPQTFQPYHFGEGCTVCGETTRTRLGPFGDCRIMRKGLILHTPTGTFHKGGFIYYGTCRGLVSGFVQGVPLNGPANGPAVFACMVVQYRDIGNGSWTTTEGAVAVDARMIEGALPFVSISDVSVRPLSIRV